MKRLKTAVTLAALLCIGAAYAQMPSMEAPAEIKKCDWMVGAWKGEFDWTMEGMPAMKMTSTMTVSIENQFLKLVAVNDMMGMKMNEVAYMGWDAEQKRYEMHTFTNFAPRARVEYSTKFTDKEWVFQSEPWRVMPTEDPIVGRATMTILSKTEMGMKLEFKEGDKWNTVATGKYTKS